MGQDSWGNKHQRVLQSSFWKSQPGPRGLGFYPMERISGVELIRYTLYGELYGELARYKHFF